jgi:hypothetical protein
LIIPDILARDHPVHRFLNHSQKLDNLGFDPSTPVVGVSEQDLALEREAMKGKGEAAFENGLPGQGVFQIAKGVEQVAGRLGRDHVPAPQRWEQGQRVARSGARVTQYQFDRAERAPVKRWVGGV